jgi:thiamine pyrophosphate-dependent acetolactate synthase large subunit-like protein
MDMVAVAEACGWATGREVRTADELAAAVAWAGSADGPVFIRVHIGVAQLKTNYFLEDPAVLAEDFRRWLKTAQQSPSCLG